MIEDKADSDEGVGVFDEGEDVGFWAEELEGRYSNFNFKLNLKLGVIIINYLQMIIDFKTY